jgi:hypothetical protein
MNYLMHDEFLQLQINMSTTQFLIVNVYGEIKGYSLRLIKAYVRAITKILNPL